MVRDIGLEIILVDVLWSFVFFLGGIIVLCFGVVCFGYLECFVFFRIC